MATMAYNVSPPLGGRQCRFEKRQHPKKTHPPWEMVITLNYTALAPTMTTPCCQNINSTAPMGLMRRMVTEPLPNAGSINFR